MRLLAIILLAIKITVPIDMGDEDNMTSIAQALHRFHRVGRQVSPEVMDEFYRMRIKHIPLKGFTTRTVNRLARELEMKIKS